MNDTGTIEKLSDLMAASMEEASKSYKQDLKILPDAKIVKIGGQSIMDRGRAAVFPILEELVANKEKHDLIITTGGGTRARHTYQVGIDLRLPVGVLADMGKSITVQNARMLQMLLAKHGGIFTDLEDFGKIPLFLRMGCIPIMPGMPPYSYWEEIPNSGSIPMNRTDAGAFFTAEGLGTKRVFLIKDEKGLFTDDPKKNPKAKFIPRIHASELKEMDLGDLVVERVLLDYLLVSQSVKEIHIFNGLEKGNVTRALNGEDVGTVIYSDGN